jgi:hypothetical protein
VGGEPLPVSVRSEPIVGYRIWRVKPTTAGLAFWSLMQNYEWQVENTAECLTNRIVPGPQMWNMPVPPKHETAAPGVECACGFYVMLPDHHLSEWTHMVRGQVHASGSVALTGRVIRCTMGYKAEHAEIQSPVVLDVTCAASEKCLLDVVTVDLQADRARGWCGIHAPGVGALVEVSAYMRNACQQLEQKYGIEVIAWQT